MAVNDNAPVDDGLNRMRKTTVIKTFVLFLVMALLASVVSVFIVVGAMIAKGGMRLVIGADGGLNPALIKWSTMLTMLMTPLCSLLVLLPRKTRTVIRADDGLGLGVRGLRGKLGTKTEFSAWLKSIGVGLLVMVVIMLALQVVGGIGNAVIKAMGGSPSTTSNQTTQEILDSMKASLGNGHAMEIVLMVLMAGVLGPFVEEVVFRGVIARSLVRSDFLIGRFGNGRMRTFLACLVSGLLFGLAHIMSTDLTFSWMNVLTVLVTWGLGTVLSWLAAVKYDSLWPGIFAHVSYNTASLLISLL